MAGKLNLVIDQGATYNKHFRMKDANGDAFDLSDYTMRAQIRKTYDGALQANFGTEISDAPNGAFQIVLAASASAGITAGNYFYDVEIYTSGSADVKRLIEGELEIRPEATK